MEMRKFLPPACDEEPPSLLGFGAPPGTLHRLDLRTQEFPREFSRCSTHAFGVAEAVELARELNHLPGCLIFHGMEGKDIGSGEGLSPEVERTLSPTLECILKDFRVLVDQSIG